MFLMLLTLWAVLHAMKYSANWYLTILTGVTLALACLTRPTAQFLIFLLPIIFPFISFLRSDFPLKFSFLHGGLATLVALILLTPWALFVQSVDGHIGLSDSQSRYRFLWDQIIMVESHSNNLSYHAASQKIENHPNGAKARLVKKAGSNWEKWDTRERYAYLANSGFDVLLSYSPKDLAYSYIRSIGQFLMSGGSGRWRYLLNTCLLYTSPSPRD